MTGTNEAALDLAELIRLVRAADPAAILVPPRLLRRVIKFDRKITTLGLQVPHRKSYVLSRTALLAIVEPDELDLPPDTHLPATVLLLTRPEPEKLAAMPRGVALVKYWRLLFHCRIHQAIEERLADHRLTEATIRGRIHRIGQTEFDEVRAVLSTERYLLLPRDNRTAYSEFAALFLELLYFDRNLLPRYFPTIRDPEHVAKVLAEDVEAATLYEQTRLAGAPNPVFSKEQDLLSVSTAANDGLLLNAPPCTELQGRQLLADAKRAAAVGNVVRAALRRTRAAQVPTLAAQAQAEAEADLKKLVERLRVALGLETAKAAAWQATLAPLLQPAASGTWPAEARLLYDLQKVCVDIERPVQAPQLFRWLLSRGQQPLARPLPELPAVLSLKHLRGAAHRLTAARLAEPDRRRLADLMQDACDGLEEQLRQRFRPLLRDTLTEVGFQPVNYPERVSFDKLVEELLDRIVERGFLMLGDLRDAVARNAVKMPDLEGPGEFFHGDRLLQVNERLTRNLEGIYRGGEIYLRWLQRLSALAFGTNLGRFLTLFVALPFGGAYAVLVGLQEIVHLTEKTIHFLAAAEAEVVAVSETSKLPAPNDLPHQSPHTLPLATLPATLVVGVLLLLLLHVPPFRAALLRALIWLGRGLRLMCLDAPAWLLRQPAVRRVLESRPVRVGIRFVVKPAMLAVLAWPLCRLAGLGVHGSATATASLFVALSAFLNSRLGRDVEEVSVDWAARNYAWLSTDVLPGLYRLIMDWSRRVLETVDRFLYSVDEWLRFRSGESKITLACKAVLNGLWQVVTYLVRIYVNLLIEPTVNPIKHFPVVTVAAKMLVPFWLTLPWVLGAPFWFLGEAAVFAIGTINLHLLPGLAGFLAWELKENWRLYEANRPSTLKPIPIGHHGETMLRFLKPGLHSGTVPKLLTRLRRAERRAQRSGDWRPIRKYREQLHHVEEALRRFVKRDFVVLLQGSKRWTAGPVEIEHLETGSNRIRIDLACPHKSDVERVQIAFEEQAGWLLAGIARPGWLHQLSAESAAAFNLALIGFYKLSGVDLVREQLQSQFSKPAPPYDISDEGLVVWPGEGYESEVAYDLEQGPLLVPRSVLGADPSGMPVLRAEGVLFRNVPVTWSEWVAAWEQDQTGAASSLDQRRLLPPAS